MCAKDKCLFSIAILSQNGKLFTDITRTRNEIRENANNHFREHCSFPSMRKFHPLHNEPKSEAISTGVESLNVQAGRRAESS